VPMLGCVEGQGISGVPRRDLLGVCMLMPSVSSRLEGRNAFRGCLLT
jgi:hypothetical protein